MLERRLKTSPTISARSRRRALPGAHEPASTAVDAGADGLSAGSGGRRLTRRWLRLLGDVWYAAVALLSEPVSRLSKVGALWRMGVRRRCGDRPDESLTLASSPGSIRGSAILWIGRKRHRHHSPWPRMTAWKGTTGVITTCGITRRWWRVRRLASAARLPCAWPLTAPRCLFKAATPAATPKRSRRSRMGAARSSPTPLGATGGTRNPARRPRISPYRGIA